jgi:hypothetical protein
VSLHSNAPTTEPNRWSSSQLLRRLPPDDTYWPFDPCPLTLKVLNRVSPFSQILFFGVHILKFYLFLINMRPGICYLNTHCFCFWFTCWASVLLCTLALLATDFTFLLTFSTWLPILFSIHRHIGDCLQHLWLVTEHQLINSLLMICDRLCQPLYLLLGFLAALFYITWHKAHISVWWVCPFTSMQPPFYRVVITPSSAAWPNYWSNSSSLPDISSCSIPLTFLIVLLVSMFPFHPNAPR